MQNDWEAFLSLCLKAKDENELTLLLNFFLTIDEKENIIDRVSITKALLKADCPQREIAQKCQVSIAKITRGSNALKTISPALRQFLLMYL